MVSIRSRDGRDHGARHFRWFESLLRSCRSIYAQSLYIYYISIYIYRYISIKAKNTQSFRYIPNWPWLLDQIAEKTHIRKSLLPPHSVSGGMALRTLLHGFHHGRSLGLPRGQWSPVGFVHSVLLKELATTWGAELQGYDMLWPWIRVASFEWIELGIKFEGFHGLARAYGFLERNNNIMVTTYHHDTQHKPTKQKVRRVWHPLFWG